ncbi:MAG: polysaccharide lyase 8 family protein [Planctomycetaceae bacterium]|mgnify:CR=1 FL=1|nr:polysaccharide lyase 8 family protein [Planctomycetaceae bacterium]
MPSRRRTTLLAFCVTVLAQAVAAAADDLETIRARVMAPLLAAPEAKAAERLIDSLRPDGTWPDIDYTQDSRSAWSVPAHLSRVETLARAYHASKSPLHGDAHVLAATQKGLDAWLRLDPQNPNWWWNQIGVPRSILPILLLLDDDLSDEQRAGGLEILRRAKIGMTGQNLVWVTEITAGRGLLERDPELTAKAYARIAEEICVSLSEGIQPDFSFHQHGPCVYSHGYGAAFIVDCSQIAAQLNGTSFAFPPEKIELLSHLILDGTQWMTRNDATDFGAEGREITRRGQSAGHLATAAGYMLQLKTGREDEFRALAARAAGRADAPPLVGNRHFWRGDFMTHHRPNFYASARMHSKRLANTDGPANSEGLLSHHLADGCFVLVQTGREYRDVYGAWDWQKIPGTTVRQKPELAGSPRRMGTTEFVGGVSDGTFGLAAFDFERDGLTAKKSWFFFDDEIVCLGAGITASAGDPVVTILNQCRLNGDVLAAGARVLDRGEHVLDKPQWLWHDSAGYVFLEPAGVHLQNDARSGSWHASNRRYPERPETLDLFTAWIDHGAEPRAASYGYVVVPGIDRDQVAGYAAKSPVRTLANAPELQAVAHDGLGLVGAAFYGPGKIELRPGRTLQVDKPCLLLAHRQDGQIAVTVANPENKPAQVRVTVVAGDGQPASKELVIELPEGYDAGSSVTRTVSFD